MNLLDLFILGLDHGKSLQTKHELRINRLVPPPGCPRLQAQVGRDLFYPGTRAARAPLWALAPPASRFRRVIPIWNIERARRFQGAPGPLNEFYFTLPLATSSSK